MPVYLVTVRAGHVPLVGDAATADVVLLANGAPLAGGLPMAGAVPLMAEVLLFGEVPLNGDVPLIGCVPFTGCVPLIGCVPLTDCILLAQALGGNVTVAKIGLTQVKMVDVPLAVITRGAVKVVTGADVKVETATVTCSIFHVVTVLSLLVADSCLYVL